jgi:hypothetical protein
LEDQFEAPSSIIPRGKLERYLRGLVSCFSLVAMAALAIPAIVAGLAVYGLRSFGSTWTPWGKLQVLIVSIVALGYAWTNWVAYWRVAPASFDSRSCGRMLLSIIHRNLGVSRGEKLAANRTRVPEDMKWRRR